MAQGDMIVVRYADDLVAGFQHRAEAERFLKDFRSGWQSSGWSFIRRKRA
jgi:hypothetical protein